MAAFAGPPNPAQYWATRRPLPLGSGPASAADRMQAPAPVLGALALAVAAVLPDLAGRVPLGPAAKLGRLRVQAIEAGIRPGSRRAGAPPPRQWPLGVQVGQRGPMPPRPAPTPRVPGSGVRVPGPEVFVPPWPAGPAESPVLRALRALGSPLVNRLLGALELAVDVLPTAGAPTGVAGLLPPPPSGSVLYAGVYVGEDDEAGRAVITLDQIRRGATTLVADLTWALAGHPQIAPLLTAAPDAPAPTPEAPAPASASASDGPTMPTRDAAAAEAAVAARHGAAHLALGVAAAAVVLRELAVPGVGIDAAAVIGVGLGAAVELLTNTPMPPAYAQAALARRRAEYLLPRTAHGQVQLAGHCFGLFEGAFPVAAVPGDGAFAGNGLVQVVPGGAVIRAGSAAAVVHVTIKVLAGPPEQVELVGWDEVVDVSWTAAAGAASVLGPAQPGAPVEPGGLAQQTPPWPGEYRLRVHATGRDDAVEAAGAVDAGAVDGDVAATQALAPAGGYIVSRTESYLLTVWAAPATAPIMHKRTDRLGYRLRGEQEPATPPRPEKSYSWIGRSGLSEAATITVITGLGLDDVVRAFQADPQSATTLQSARDQAGHRFSVSFLAVDGAVLAVEDNGFMGSAAEVLRPLSAQGRAASIFWNINTVRRLNLAEGGELLATLELPHDGPVPAAAAPYLADLDLADYRDGAAKGLAAVARFTGYQVRPADLTRIEEADRAYLIRS
ncbi:MULTISPECIES: DUF6461 domain-containing protein [Parafrankia]|uniref:DUF6461 domain-containing protein n=1 Tax=Parafrankia TaxID=2994362 RepID=UPI001D029705|nr:MULTISPECIES: DUF6461 domain-containing protein [Parafrankia]